MRSLKNALLDFVKNNGIEKPIDQGRALFLWEKVVGPKTGKVARATDIENGILTVKSDNEVWRQELQLMKPELIKKINKEVGKKTVTDIRFL